MFDIPTHCPSCLSKLSREGPNLYCRNGKCPGVVGKVLEAFCRVTKIRGLGPKSLDKLQFSDIMDIYRSDAQVYCDKLGTLIGNKVYREVQKSRDLRMSHILPALSIPLIGRTATEKLATSYKSLREVYEARDVENCIGPAAASKLRHWLNCNKHIWEYLPQKDEFDTPVSFEKTICISGRLKSFKTKAEAAKALKGYKVVENLTSKVNLLVNESGIASSKTQKAEKLGIPIITNIKELF